MTVDRLYGFFFFFFFLVLLAQVLYFIEAKTHWISEECVHKSVQDHGQRNPTSAKHCLAFLLWYRIHLQFVTFYFIHFRYWSLSPNGWYRRLRH